MNGLSQETLLMALKIAIVPVMLLSVLWRNRLEKRRRTEATEQEQLARSARARREIIDLPATDISGMQMALDRLRNGAFLVSPRNEPVTEPMLRGALAAARRHRRRTH